ncbi:MAG: hypothetical protein KC731_12660, partial [Myxococcales bacterium]|nr:hypothetical protein [Myxococcales bacterium]
MTASHHRHPSRPPKSGRRRLRAALVGIATIAASACSGDSPERVASKADSLGNCPDLATVPT